MLGEVDVRELAPTPCEFGFGERARDHVRHEGDAQQLYARHNFLFAPALEPLGFQRDEEAVDESLRARGQTAGLGRAERLDFLQRQERAADLGDAVLDGEVSVRAPRQRVLDIAPHRHERGAHIAVKK